MLLLKRIKKRYIKFIEITIFISLSLFAKSLLKIVHNKPDGKEINVNFSKFLNNENNRISNVIAAYDK